LIQDQVNKQASNYWTSRAKAEIDFINTIDGSIIPIEVKSGNAVKSKSMKVYSEKYAPQLKIRMSFKNLTLDDNFLNIPMFYADHIKTFAIKAMKSRIIKG